MERVETVEPAGERGMRDVLLVLTGALLFCFVVSRFVETDKQRIEKLLAGFESAFHNQDAQRISGMVSEQCQLATFSVSFVPLPPRKVAESMNFLFSKFGLQRIVEKRYEIVVSRESARVNFRVKTQFGPSGGGSRLYLRGSLSLEKQAGAVWKIHRIELIEQRGEAG